MNWVDYLILLWAISAAVRGYYSGFLRLALSFGGFLTGLLAGGWLAPHIAAWFEGGSSKALVTLITTLGIAILFASIGERLAARVREVIQLHLAHKANNFLGVVLGVMFVLVSSWLIAAALTRLPFAQVGLVIEQSKIVKSMNRVMPPAPGVMEKLGRLISPQGFPEVFVGNEPQIDPAGPASTPEVEAAAAKASQSTARIEGFACGGVSTGSGFVAAPNYVATNAHVVAGVRQPIVLINGQRYRADVVLFNTKLDFAVLRTDSRLTAPALTLSSQGSPRGTTTAVLGYPGGGSLRISPAVVLRSQIALGRDIYNRNLTTRQIYALQTHIEPGNSGGPVVLPDGKVAGVIFGESVTQDNIGYALTADAVRTDLTEALNQTTPVSTGSCL